MTRFPHVPPVALKRNLKEWLRFAHTAHFHWPLLTQVTTFSALQMAEVVNSGRLLEDHLILDVLQGRLERGRERGETGVLLDGFPRTRAQAEALNGFADVQLALNLHVNEEVTELSLARYNPLLWHLNCTI